VWDAVRVASRPRVLSDAARSAAMLYLFGAVLVGLENFVIPSVRFVEDTWIPWLVVAFVAAAGACVWRIPERLPAIVWPAVPILAAGIILVLGIGSHDASASAQLAFCWPVLFASYHLPRSMARAVTGVVVCCEIMLCIAADAPGAVIADALGVSVILTAVMVTLVHARDRMEGAIKGLQHLVEHDALTGLSSRRTFDSDIDTLNEGQRTALILIDIDEFKTVNDTFGHAAGDDVLRIVASCLVANSRARDSIYRLGGDEFALLLRGCPPDAAARRAETIRGAVERARAVVGEGPDGGVSPGVTVSVGVACMPDHARSRVELLGVADAAMYSAKNIGRNRVTVATPVGPLASPPALRGHTAA
jgi:diguanylate cyclase (GGDEF)-like protein